MKRTLCLILASMALPALAQSDPSSAVPSPKPAEANPFNDSISVTLTAGGNAAIEWDFGTSTAPLAPGEGKPYDSTTPVRIKSTGILRTLAVFNGMGQDPLPANYAYVKNIKPTVTITSPTAGQSFRPGQTINLSATVADTGGPQPLTVRFYRVNGSVWSELPGSPLASPPYNLAWPLDASAPIGTIPLRVVATDGKALADTGAVSVTIAANKAPTVTLLPANNSTYLGSVTLTLTATPADADGAITKVAFFKGTDSLGEDVSGPPWTSAPLTLGEGTYALKAVAYDNGLPILTGTAISNVTVSKNNPPKVTVGINAPAGGGKVYYAPYAASISATATDTDGGVAQVEFFANGISESVDATSPYGYSKSLPAGHYSFTAKATDSLNASATSDSLVINVVANQKPTAKTGKDTTLYAPTATVQLNGSGSLDPEGTLLKYKWTGPAGVTFNNDTLASPIATFPANSFGAFALQLKVSDRGEPVLSDSVKMTVTVWDRPKITSPTTAGGAANQNFTYVITGTGFPAPAFDAPTKPSWLTYNAATATLAGKPTAQGTFTATLNATSAAGSDSKTLTITIGDSLYKPSITSALSASGKVGTGFSYAITARGNPSNFTYSATGLPAGIGLSGSNLTGTPTASGNFTVALTVSNSLGSDTKNLSLSINQDPKITKDLTDTVPTVYEKTSVTFSVQATGFPAVSYQWQFSAGSATTGFGPVGTGSSATYVINPTSTANSGYYRVIVKNSVGEVTSKACRLKVNPIPAPVKITQAPTAQSAVVGDKVFFKAKATGEPLPLYYRWFRGYPTRTPVTNAKADDTVLTLDTAQVGMSDLYSVRVTSSNFPGDSTNTAYFAWSDTARLTVQLPKLAVPMANPAGGSIYKATPVTLTSTVANATIWYTLNGQDPVSGSPSLQYTGPILIDSTRTLKAKAFANQFRPSDVVSYGYFLTEPNKSAKPTILPVDSTFRGSLAVTISSSDGSDIYYSLVTADSTVTNRRYTDSLILRQTTLVKAVAVKANYTPSDTAVRVFTLEKPKTSVLDPQFTPDGGSFTGSLIVKIASPTPGAVVRYTDNGKDPDSTSAIATERGVQIARTTTLKAIGMLKDYANSPIVTREFRLGPGAIVASPAGDLVFDDAITVNLSVTPAAAIIRYTLDGSVPGPDSPIYPPEGKLFATSVTISAIAYLDGQPGSLQTFSYARKGDLLPTPIPTTPGNAFTFSTTLTVSLQTTPSIAKIYYTLDGSEPSIIPANLYRQPILLENTTTLQAVAVADGFENSKVLVATYTLVPEKPVIKPPAGSYPMPFDAQITSSSRTAVIYYTLDGTPPTPSTGIRYVRDGNIRIDSAGSLRAISVAGNMASDIATEEYGAIRFIDTTLAPGRTLFLYGGYTLRNPEDQTATVQVHTGNPSLKGLAGFEGVQYTLSLSLADPSAAPAQLFPKLALAMPATDKRSLYKVEPSGKIFFVSNGGDTVTLGAGTWFMGNDTMPPRIRYKDESFDPSDSTRVTFEVMDNVSNLGYTLVRNDDPARNISGAFLSNDQPITAQLKHPDGVLKPLLVQIRVSDFRQTAYYPAEKTTLLPLSQKLKGLQGPPAWHIGVNKLKLYDFVSIPLDLAPPLTFGELKKMNAAALLEGTEYRESEHGFHPLAAETVLRPGVGYWVAARAPVTSLRMASAATASAGGKSSFSVTLRKGWNQVSNPHLETLYWPSARSLPTYRSMVVKGLWGWDATLAIPDYVQSDSLLPWRGYFVYNYGGDVVIPLLTSPPGQSLANAPPGGAAAKSAAEGRIQIALGWDERASLSLGADPLSADGLGIEDEVSLPRQGARFLRAARNGRSLASDWVRLDRGEVKTWRVQFGSEGDSLPSLRVSEILLPPGDEAWAVSDTRGMKFALVPGASIPASGLAQDSLRVIAGPKEKVSVLLDGLSETAPRFDAKLTAVPEGFRLRLGLPSRARVRATLWSLQGARLGTLSTGLLSEGSYEFGFAADFGNRPARLGPGMYVLTVDVRGRDLSARASKKLFLAR